MDIETFYNKFKGRALSDKYNFLKDHYQNTDLFTAHYALQIMEELYRLSPRGDRERDFVNFVEKVKENRPDLYEEFPVFLKFKTVIKLGAGNSLTDNEIAELSEKYAENPDMVDGGWKSLKFHGPLYDQVQFVRMTAPRIKNNSSIIPSSIVNFIRTSIHTEIFLVLSEEDTVDSAESVVSTLRDRIEEYVEGSPVEEFPEEDTVEWINGINGNVKILAGDADPSGQYRRAARLFTHYLRKDKGYEWSRACTAGDQLCRYFLERSDGELRPRQSMMKEQKGEPASEQTDVRSEEQFLPDKETFHIFLKDLLPRIKPQDYTVATVAIAVPHWLDFTMEHSLAEAEAVQQVQQNMTPLYEELKERFRKRFPDRMIQEKLDELISE